MSKNVTVYSLMDCDKCKDVLEFLDKNGVLYTKIECYGDNSECDNMEDLTNFSRYPVIKFLSPGKKEIYFGYGKNAKKEGQVQELTTSSVSYTYSSVDKMKNGFFDHVKK